jgi:hypothetical protein
MLHVRCGDDIIGTLRAAGLPGEFLVWADPVCQGPIPATVRGDAWYALRADFIARAYGADPAEAAGRLRAADAALAARDRHEEIVLWFEHDLFDQAILVQLLARLAEQRAHQLSLVTLDSHPSTSRFIGLGQLDSADLAELFARRFVVTAEMLAAGSAAWAALGAPTPEPAAELARAPGGALPFLPAALTRHLRELPSVEQGLGRTEQLVLEAAAAGAGSAGEVFQAVQEREPAPWLGDSMLYAGGSQRDGAMGRGSRASRHARRLAVGRV